MKLVVAIYIFNIFIFIFIFIFNSLIQNAGLSSQPCHDSKKNFHP